MTKATEQAEPGQDAETESELTSRLVPAATGHELLCINLDEVLAYSQKLEAYSEEHQIDEYFRLDRSPDDVARAPIIAWEIFSDGQVWPVTLSTWMEKHAYQENSVTAVRDPSGNIWVSHLKKPYTTENQFRMTARETLMSRARAQKQGGAA